MRKSGLFSYVRQDLLASIVVFLVALPLCLGIALASGAPLISGLIAGIIGGIIIGSLSKSHLSVSGPAAGLVVIVLGGIERLGSYEAFVMAVVVAGVVQLILGFSKAGIIGMYFPSAVIKGMLAAIGLILILKQIPHLVGFDADAFGEMEFLQQDGSNTFTYLISSFDHVYLGSLVVGASCLLLLILWEQPFVKKSVLKQIPGGVLAVLIGVGINESFKFFAPHLTIDASHLVNLPVIDDFGSFMAVMTFPDFSMLTDIDVYIIGATLAIVASLETLLCTEAVEKLDPHKRRIPQNAELKAQGVGNVLSGMLGGLPITSVIVRSSANVDAGAETKLSAIIHGFLLLGAIAIFPLVMNMIPLSALAAVLIVVGFKLTRPSLYIYHYRLGNEQFKPFVATVLAILFTDLLIGILIGLGVGIYYILKANFKGPYYYDEHVPRDEDRTHITVKLSEHVSFLNKAGLQLRFEQIPPNAHVTIDGSLSRVIDYDALEVIHEFKSTAHERDIDVTMKDVPDLKVA